MPKAINWPEHFYDEVMSEKLNDTKIALRIGDLYFSTNYYKKGERVDIRVNHKIARKAQILEDMKLVKIKDLNSDMIALYKKELNSKERIINFLSTNYNQPVDKNTEVSLVIYKNIPNDEE